VAGGFDLGANGLFGLGGASRVFLFPVWGGWWRCWRSGGLHGVGGGLAYVGVVPGNLGYSI